MLIIVRFQWLLSIYFLIEVCCALLFFSLDDLLKFMKLDLHFNVNLFQFMIFFINFNFIVRIEWMVYSALWLFAISIAFSYHTILFRWIETIRRMVEHKVSECNILFLSLSILFMRKRLTNLTKIYVHIVVFFVIYRLNTSARGLIIIWCLILLYTLYHFFF